MFNFVAQSQSHQSRTLISI